MKRSAALLLSALLLALAACAAVPDPAPSPSAPGVPAPPEGSPAVLTQNETDYAFRAAAYGVAYEGYGRPGQPELTAASGPEELAALLPAEPSGRLREAADRYDAAWFGTHRLLLLRVTEPSGSNSHEVTGVRSDGEALTVDLTRILPEVGTCDMADWLLLIEVDGTPPADLPLRVSVSLRQTWSWYCANATLTLPEGWVCTPEEGKDGFQLSLRPEGEAGGLLLRVQDSPEGVCGTGLTLETLTFPSGLTAEQGTYDGGAQWTFLRFLGLPGDYTVWNQGAADWWEAHGEEAMAILAGAEFGLGSLTEPKAVALAKAACTVDYANIRTRFDLVSGLWTVDFLPQGAGGGQTVTVARDGSVSSVWGE